MEISYSPPIELPPRPGSAEGSRRSSLGSLSASVMGSNQTSAPPSDDENALEDIGRSIANLELIMERDADGSRLDIESGDETRARKLKIAGKKLFRLVLLSFYNPLESTLIQKT